MLQMKTGAVVFLLTLLVLASHSWRENDILSQFLRLNTSLTGFDFIQSFLNIQHKPHFTAVPNITKIKMKSLEGAGQSSRELWAFFTKPRSANFIQHKKTTSPEQGGSKSRREVTKSPFFSKPHPATKTKKVAKLPVFPKPHIATKEKKVAKLPVFLKPRTATKTNKRAKQPVFSEPHSATKNKKNPNKRCIYAKGFKFCRSLDHKKKA